MLKYKSLTGFSEFLIYREEFLAVPGICYNELLLSGCFQDNIQEGAISKHSDVRRADICTYAVRSMYKSKRVYRGIHPGNIPRL